MHIGQGILSACSADVIPLLMFTTMVLLWDQEPWIRLTISMMLALILAIWLRWLAYRLLQRWIQKHSAATTMLLRARTPLGWLIPLLMLNIAVYATPGIQNLHWLPTIRQMLLILLMANGTWLGVCSISALEASIMHFYPVDVEDNLHARAVRTQVRMLCRIGMVVVIILGLAAILMAIPGVRQVGTSLLASAGLAGLAFGLAAKPVLSNLMAGVQIALTQPIRLDDVVIVQGEWGRIEEITNTYVVVYIWDQRRLIVPLNWFIENPFQNWTRSTSQLIGTVFLWVDYRMPLQPLREELERLCGQALEYDGRVCLLQVTDVSEKSMQLRALVSSTDSARNWNLRCRIREGLIAFIQRDYPDYLPHWRGQLNDEHQQPRPSYPQEPDLASAP